MTWISEGGNAYNSTLGPYRIQRIDGTDYLLVSSPGRPDDVVRIPLSELLNNPANYDQEMNLYWADNVSELFTRNGSSAPSVANLRNGLWAWQFSATQAREVFTQYHLNHDIALTAGLKIYPHFHWTPGNSASSGVVRWGFEYTLAKGHQQGAISDFAATYTVYVNQTCNNTPYRHYVAEVSDGDAIPVTNCEPDTLILMRIFRDAADPADTFPDPVFGLTADVHYLANRIGTKNKAPNFYA